MVRGKITELAAPNNIEPNISPTSGNPLWIMNSVMRLDPVAIMYKYINFWEDLPRKNENTNLKMVMVIQ